ncbi:PIN domain nuclease [Spartobacteria bacterium LR76]|nr:PIN domain nuclease [Spartobacteria bacterium LR76]
MRLLDSNIIIYATLSENEWLREWLETEPLAVSQISRVEILGYHLLKEEERRDLAGFLDALLVMPITTEITDRAIALRQQRKMGLGDSLVAGTAIETGCELVTRNVEDFRWVEDLRVINPFESR